MIALSSLLSGSVAALGGRVVWPRESIDSVRVRVSAVETRTSAHRAAIDSLRTSQGEQRYLLCEVLKRVSPAGAVLPEACNP